MAKRDHQEPEASTAPPPEEQLGQVFVHLCRTAQNWEAHSFVELFGQHVATEPEIVFAVGQTGVAEFTSASLPSSSSEKYWLVRLPGLDCLLPCAASDKEFHGLRGFVQEADSALGGIKPRGITGCVPALVSPCRSKPASLRWDIHSCFLDLFKDGLAAS